MTPRERVRIVLSHKLPDRIPNGLGGCETEGMHLLAYDRLQTVLGVERVAPRMDTFMTNAVFELPVIRAMEGDIILLASPNMCKSDLRGKHAEDQWKEQSFWGKTFRVSVRDLFSLRDDGTMVWETAGGSICPKGGFYFDHAGTTDMLADFSIPDPDNFHPRDTIDDKILRKLEESARHLYEETDLSICLGESITDLQIMPGGMIGGMVLMKENPGIMKEFLDKCADAGLKQIELLDQAVGKYVDILAVAHDIGDNRGVTVGADLWKEIYADAYKKYFDGWKKRTRMRVSLHSCGSISDVLETLIDCGLEVLNPIQISAAGMDPQNLKNRFGSRIVMWGGAYDAQLFDCSLKYNDVYDSVKKNIELLKTNGNYIFSGVHNLPATMPVEHIRAMLDAYYDSREY